MEYDFSYLTFKYTLAGAREKFEDICADLLRSIHGAGEVHRIDPHPGDDGIDVAVGDFHAPIHNFQCKFFPGGIGDSQKAQIRKSFRSALSQDRYFMREWTLCVSRDLTPAEMTWWSNWKQQAEKEAGIPISLWDGGTLLRLLKDHGLYDQVFDIRINTILEELHNGLYDQGIGHMAQVLSPGMIAQAYEQCNDTDIRNFYSVDNSFFTMLNVICRGEDIPYEGAPQAVLNRCREGRPVIITGNSGTGKTSLMLRTAVEWVRDGGTALWLSLSGDDCITAAAASSFYRAVQKLASADRRVLLCIDDPYDGKASLSSLQKHWPRDRRLQLLMAERRSRLDQLADENGDHLQRWFDDACVIVLEGTGQKYPYQLSDYDCQAFFESTPRRKQILKTCIRFYDPAAEDQIPQLLLEFGKSTVSIVELLYRTLFRLKKLAGERPGAGFGKRAPKVSKSPDIRLDWDEWRSVIRKRFGKNHPAQDSYGMLAACSFFGGQISLPLFCKHFDLNQTALLQTLEDLRLTHHIEPVVYLKGANALRPKHEVAAELFFLFHPRRDINTELSQLLDAMNELEIDSLLAGMVSKGDLQRGAKNQLRRIRYQEHFQRIYDRHRDPKVDLILTPESCARLCLGFWWTVPKNDRSGRNREIAEIFDDIAPPIDGSRLMAILYTEWGRLLTTLKRDTAAEEKFRAVIAQHSQNIHSRTELGRLLAKQKGRENEAEKVLRETMQIAPNDIQSRTELGRLLAKQKGRENEAEQFLREAIRIDPKNLHPHTELGRLLAKQKGRENEAEQFLRKAMQIDPNHIQSRTELGRLLAKQKDRENEAEQFLREATRIDPWNIHPHTELGRLLAGLPGREEEAIPFLQKAIQLDPKQLHPRNVLAELYIRLGRPAEAEGLYQKMLQIDPQNDYAKRGLAHLRQLPPFGSV